MLKLLISIFLFFTAVSVYADSVVMVGFGATSSFTGVFRSDFDDATEDAKWNALPAGWNDDYTTTVLEGTESCLTDTTAWDGMASFTFTAQSSGTTYTRMAFGAASAPSVNSGYGVWLELQTDGTGIVACHLIADSTASNGFRYIAARAVGTETADAFDSGAALLNDAAYYLEMTYIRGTSVTCRVVQSDGSTTWDGSSATHSTSNNASINGVGISNGDAGAALILDEVEVRAETNWGN